MSFFRKIPGYRSKTVWKMVFASFFYFMVLMFIIAGFVEIPDEAVSNEDVALTQEENGIDVDKGEDGAVNQDEPLLVETDPDSLDEPIEEVIDPKPVTAEGQLIAHFINVGQGDAIFIQTPAKNILIDGGDRGTTVANYLRNQGISSLDLVIGTHPHADHIGGLINVFQSIPVKEVIDPAVVHTTKTFEDYLTLIDKKDIKFTEGRAGMNRDLGGGAQLELLHPTSPSSSHLNNASIVARLVFGQVSFLFTGDAETEAEKEMLNRSAALVSDILKVGHHGSRTSTTQAFLQGVDPEVAVIMCGKDNQYGHPHEEILQRLANAGVDIYRTDLHGTIVITTDGQTYDINIKQPYQYTPQKVPEPKAEEPEAVPEPAPVESGRFVGSTQSDRYHNPSCRHAKNILSQNEIWFDSAQDAKSKGYVPCGVCRPPQ